MLLFHPAFTLFAWGSLREHVEDSLVLAMQKHLKAYFLPCALSTFLEEVSSESAARKFNGFPVNVCSQFSR